MAIQTKVTISPKSTIKNVSIESLDIKVKKALNNSFGGNVNLYCDIIIDGELPDKIQNQLTKVGKNLFVGFSEGIESGDTNRRAFIFECMAIKDTIIANSRIIVLIVSSSNFINIRSNKTNNDVDELEENSTVAFNATKPKFSLDKVILDEDTRNQINRSLALIRNQRLIFDTWGFRDVDPNTKTILCFFGSPGTGKTMCAHAIANELGRNIMIASYASIESKWVGEGPKNMRRIFNDAREQDAILFFDEADSFLSKRVNNAETGSDKHYNRMSNEMFQLLEDFDGIVIFATNLVTDFDKAFKSRILSFVEFTLPDDKTRKRLIQSMIPSKLPLASPMTEYDLETLASASDGFSGREIRKALLTSLSEAALNSRTTLSIDDLLIGFKSVQSEREAIEKTASRERNIISDYIEVTNQNKYIIDVCQWAINQFEEVTDSTKETLYKICKLLNLEMPDLSTSFRNKNLDSACKSIIESNRSKETVRYVVYLTGSLDVDITKAKNTILSLCIKLQCDEANVYIKYLETYKALLK